MNFAYVTAFLGLLSLPSGEARINVEHRRARMSGFPGGEPPEPNATGSHRERRSCSNPTQKAPVKFPEKLIGRVNQNFQMYSGYIPVTSVDYLFYWYFTPRGEVAQDAPLIMWTNGGPGCSSMEGATTEISPLVLLNVKSSGAGLFSKAWSENPYAWNTNAHVLFVDQPRYVGYSTGTGSKIQSSTDAAIDIITFIKKWYTLFPGMQRLKLIIAGESYAGHYVPAWAGAMMNHNDKTSDPNEKINLGGIALGNACVDDNVQIEGKKYIEFLGIAKLLPPGAKPSSAAAAEAVAASHLGYSPNFYDYRVKKERCNVCYDYDYTEWQKWLMRDDVQTALNICDNSGANTFSGRAGGCISMGSFDSRVTNSYFSEQLGRALDRKIPVTFYFGKTDTACDYWGGRAMADQINWNGRSSFSSAPLEDFTIAGAIMGQIKQSGELTFIQVEEAGHMVPRDRPAAAHFAISHLIGLHPNSPGGCPSCPETTTFPPPAPCPEPLSSDKCKDCPSMPIECDAKACAKFTGLSNNAALECPPCLTTTVCPDVPECPTIATAMMTCPECPSCPQVPQTTPCRKPPPLNADNLSGGTPASYLKLDDSSFETGATSAIVILVVALAYMTFKAHRKSPGPRYDTLVMSDRDSRAVTINNDEDAF